MTCEWLGGRFNYYLFWFLPRTLGKWSNLTSIFWNGLKPPTIDEFWSQHVFFCKFLYHKTKLGKNNTWFRFIEIWISDMKHFGQILNKKQQSIKVREPKVPPQSYPPPQEIAGLSKGNQWLWGGTLDSHDKGIIVARFGRWDYHGNPSIGCPFLFKQSLAILRFRDLFGMVSSRDPFKGCWWPLNSE